MIWNRKYLLGAALTASAVVGGVALTPRGLETVGSARADVMSMLDARSPGARGEGAVTTKGPRMAMAAPRTSRVLPISQAPAPRQSAVLPIGAPPATLPVAALGTPAPLAAAPLVAGGAPIFAAAPAVVGGTGLGAAALLPVPIAAALLAPGGGGGGGGVTISAPDATPAIPEPATWLMMILGFGLLGTWLRHRRRTDVGAGQLGLAAT